MRRKSVLFWEKGRDSDPSPAMPTVNRGTKNLVNHSKQKIVTLQEIVAFCLCTCSPCLCPCGSHLCLCGPAFAPAAPAGTRLKQDNHPLSNTENLHLNRTN